MKGGQRDTGGIVGQDLNPSYDGKLRTADLHVFVNK